MAQLQPLFPKSHGTPGVDDRRVLSGIVFVNRNGLRCCDAPKDYGPHKAPRGPALSRHAPQCQINSLHRGQARWRGVR